MSPESDTINARTPKLPASKAIKKVPKPKTAVPKSKLKGKTEPITVGSTPQRSRRSSKPKHVPQATKKSNPKNKGGKGRDTPGFGEAAKVIQHVIPPMSDRVSEAPEDPMNETFGRVSPGHVEDTAIIATMSNNQVHNALQCLILNEKT